MTRRDRGQLVLVGAVVLAVTLVGAAAIFNSVVLTSSLAPQESKVSVEDARMYEQAVERDLQGTFDRIANGSAYAPKPALASNVTRYSHRIAEVGAGGGAVYLNVTLNGTTSSNDTRVVQRSMGQVDAEDGSDDWYIVSAADATNVTEFEFVFDADTVAASESAAFTFNVTNASAGTWWRFKLYEDPSSSSTLVDTEGPGGDLENCRVDASAVVTLNLTAVNEPTTTCGNFSFADGVEPPYSIHITKGNKPDARYELTTADPLDPSNFNAPPNDPYLLEVIETARFDFVFRDPRLTYRTQITVEAGGST